MTNHHITLATTLLLTITTLHALNITHQECLDTIAWCQNPNTLHLIAHNHHNISLDCLSNSTNKRYIQVSLITQDNNSILAEVILHIANTLSYFPNKKALHQLKTTPSIIDQFKDLGLLSSLDIINDLRKHHNFNKTTAYNRLITIGTIFLILGTLLGHIAKKKTKRPHRHLKRKQHN